MSEERGTTSAGEAEPAFLAPRSSSGGRPSAVNPAVKLERRVSLGFAGFFYGFLGLAGAVWLFNTNVKIASLFALKNPISEVLLGVGAGVLIAGACGGLAAIWKPARELEKEFGWILGEQRKFEIVILAVLSAVAEEFFFRGAMIQAVGPWVAIAVFSALHWPVNRAFLLWPFLALAVGILLTWERQVTQGLVAPILTHAVVNGINLWRITDTYRTWKE